MLSFHVKFVQTQRLMDRQRKNNMPPIFRCGGIKIVEKGENAIKDKNDHFKKFILSSVNTFNLNQTKIWTYGKELKLEHNS